MLLVAWPVAFAIVLALLRLIVLRVFGNAGANAGDLIALAGLITTGLVLALPLHLLREKRARWALYPIVVTVVFANVAAFHYEAVFGRLPGVNLLYYLRESASLQSSAAKHAPAAAVIAEVVIASAILIALAEWLRERRRATTEFAALCLLSVAITLLVLVKPSVVPRPLQWRSRTPLLWAAQSWSVQRAYGAGASSVDREDVLAFQRRLGHRVPFGGVDPRFPLCAEGARGIANPNGRSVIFLILESIASEEMKRMPALERIAADGTSFVNVKAGGTKSLQAMPALFAGIPPQPAAQLLWREPLNNLEGFPLALKEHGYRTAYFHGGDLSFEQQRPFLRMMGFEEIVELDPAERIPLYGWGYEDAVVFEKMERWIEGHRGAPYLATLFTLSTHDPYVIPNAKPGQTLREAFLASLAYEDRQLRQFYDWYLRTEAPRGTILVITGDHAPHLSGETHIEDDAVTRFDVPLIVRGPGVAKGTSANPAAHFDVSATILGLTGLPPGRCDQGLDLFSASIPGDRTRYAVAGDQLEEFYYWRGASSVHLDLVRGGGSTEAREFYGQARRLSEYLVREDAFAPPPATVQFAAAPLPRVARPVFGSHRGQSRGELAPHLQNKRQTFEQALADGFEWLELDVNLTRDEQLVVVHDSDVAGREIATLTLAELRALPGMADTLTLGEMLDAFASRAGLMIELKPQKTLGANSMLALRAALLVRAKTRPGRVVMDSYDSFLTSSLERHCGCAVGIDAPPRPLDSRWIDNAARTGLEWVYVDHRQASPELIRYAHGRGVRVAVFTVNDLAQIQRLEGEWPDAILTDRAGLVETFDAKYAGR